ncbi:unnamed protein product [Hymenolepis diminuta]|uniref:Uncharacterized protein n=1 Tax=Hymenolepis diminuta TaxID=6216 RepID=A0A564ZCU5_HYMDI|nr:unnamed protein product [Hymenolepis diminuta]
MQVNVGRHRFVTQCINGLHVDVEVDTGSDSTIVSDEAWKRPCSPKLDTFASTWVKVQSRNGPRFLPCSDYFHQFPHGQHFETPISHKTLPSIFGGKTAIRVYTATRFGRLSTISGGFDFNIDYKNTAEMGQILRTIAVLRYHACFSDGSAKATVHACGTRIIAEKNCSEIEKEVFGHHLCREMVSSISTRFGHLSTISSGFDFNIDYKNTVEVGQVNYLSRPIRNRQCPNGEIVIEPQGMEDYMQRPCYTQSSNGEGVCHRKSTGSTFSNCVGFEKVMQRVV